MRVFDFNSAIVRLPGNSVVDGLRANAGTSPTHAAVLAEHGAYVNALRAAGVQVQVLPALEDFPDSIFVEDPALVFSEAAILLRPGAPSRIGEAEELASTLASRFPKLLRLVEGHADGGDILVIRDRVLIGLSARTDETGAKALQELLASIGRDSRIVNTPRGTLHLKSDCSLVDEETVLATEELAGSGILDGLRIVLVPPGESQAANALRINDTVFVNADCRRSQEKLSKLGQHVIPLKVSEIARIDAGLSCMSLRWYDPGARSPG